MAGERDPLWGARALLRIADKAHMADKYWQTDRTIAEAREKLGVPADGRTTHAHLWQGGPVAAPGEA
jgi:hypothetical protein